MDKNINKYSLWPTNIFTVENALDVAYADEVTKWVIENPVAQHDDTFNSRSTIPPMLHHLHDYCYAMIVDLIVTKQTMIGTRAETLSFSSFATSVITGDTPRLHHTYQTHHDINAGQVGVVWYPSADHSDVAGGELALHAPSPIVSFNEAQFKHLAISKTFSNKLIVFPTDLLHRIIPYNSPNNIPRISVAMFFIIDDEPIDVSRTRTIYV